MTVFPIHLMSLYNNIYCLLKHSLECCLSVIFSITWLAGDVKEPTHFLKRVGHVLSFAVLWSGFISWVVASYLYRLTSLHLSELSKKKDYDYCMTMICVSLCNCLELCSQCNSTVLVNTFIF